MINSTKTQPIIPATSLMEPGGLQGPGDVREGVIVFVLRSALQIEMFE
jgi:hypothetical protein